MLTASAHIAMPLKNYLENSEWEDFVTRRIVQSYLEFDSLLIFKWKSQIKWIEIKLLTSLIPALAVCMIELDELQGGILKRVNLL